MKSIIFSLLVSVMSFAAPEFKSVKCTFENFQAISRSLGYKQITVGAQFKNEVISVLQQEMGPMCSVLVPVRPQYGIPGDHLTIYELHTGSARYVIIDKSSIEMPSKNSVEIQKQVRAR